MKKDVARFLSVFVFLSIMVSCAGVEKTGDTVGKAEEHPITEVVMPTPESAAQQKYLGIMGKEDFSVADIDADVVLVEIFSMYCPYCQKEAPEVNKLFRMMENSKRAGGRVKLIGIGVGNTAYEVGIFRESFDIEFPLIPDGEYEIHKAIGSVRTPFFLAVRNYDQGPSMVIHKHIGGIEDLEKFLDTMLDRAGL